mgnify:CR=1 FL=1
METIIQGDCLVEMRKFADKSFDLILTDPPYGIDYQSNMRVRSKRFDKLENDNNGSRLDSYPEMYRVLKDNCVAVIFCSFKNFAEDMTVIEKLFDVKNVVVWDKGGGGIGDLTHSLLTDYELGIVAHKGQCRIRGKRDGSVWREGKVFNMTMQHPTEKPVNLMARFIDKFTDEGATVLDPYMGSGTTLVAAKQLNRNATGIEISEKYCEIAHKRLSQEMLF